MRDKGLRILDQRDAQCKSRPLQFVKDAAGTVAWEYQTQFVKAFNQYSWMAHALVVASC
jgi:hypothetical protein